MMSLAEAIALVERTGLNWGIEKRELRTLARLRILNADDLKTSLTRCPYVAFVEEQVGAGATPEEALLKALREFCRWDPAAGQRLSGDFLNSLREAGL